MINFKNKDEAVPSAVIIASILVLLATLVVMIFVPKPSAAGTAKKYELQEKQLQQQIDSAKDQAEKAEANAAPRLWQGDPQTIMARLLAQLTSAADHGHLQMSSFRPQKQTLFPGVIELPFTLQIAGPYPAVRSFLTTLDNPAGAIVLRSVQMAAADGATDSVTVMVSISVYCHDASANAAATASSETAAAGAERTATTRPAATKPAATKPATGAKTTGAAGG